MYRIDRLITRREALDFVIATVILTAAFLLLERRLVILNPLLGIASIFIAVLTGFDLHEYMHREVARRLGYISYFKASYIGLLLAIITAISGFFVIAAPGAAIVLGPVRRRDEVLISIAGPATNLAFAGLFYALYLFMPYPIDFISYIIYSVNAWLGFINLLPIPFPVMLDGFRIMRNNPILWSVVFIASVLLLIPALVIR